MSIANVSAQRLTDISVEAQYITDKMAVELGLNSYQRNSILQFNLSYLNGITSYRDIGARIWKQRNRQLKAVLSSAQWRMYQDAYYFYRPIGWKDGAYVHNIYAKYPRRHGYRPECDRPQPRYGKPGKGPKPWGGPKHDKGPRHHDKGPRHHDNGRFGPRR